MHISLLHDRARVTLDGEEGYLTKATIHGHSSIGILTNAGVFRPITDQESLSPHGLSSAVFKVLPSYLTFIEELDAKKIVTVHSPISQKRDARAPA